MGEATEQNMLACDSGAKVRTTLEWHNSFRERFLGVV